MDTSSHISFASHANAFTGALSLETVRQRAPAVFASSAHERMSSRLHVHTDRAECCHRLMQAGFVPVDARQTVARQSKSNIHARHVVRLRRCFETVQLQGLSALVVFLNGHDGTSAPTSFAWALFRVVCTNGLIVSRGAFPAYCVSHQGNVVVDDVIAGALETSERFGCLADQVEHMERRTMFKDEQIDFARRALTLRFPDPDQHGMQPACGYRAAGEPRTWGGEPVELLKLSSGEFVRRRFYVGLSATGRLTRTRRLTSIKEDVGVNGQLWDLAMEVLAA